MSHPEPDGAGEAGRPASPAPDPALSPTGRIYRPVVLDGPRRLGLRAAGAGQRRRAGEHAGLRRPPAHAGRTASSRPPAWPSACRRGRWATPRSATSTSAPGASSTRSSRASRAPSRRASSSPTRSSRTPWRRRASAARPSTSWGSSRRAACTPISVTSRRCLEMARREGVTDVVVHAFLDGRDTPPRSAGEYLSEVADAHGGHRRRSLRHRHRTLLRDGPRQPLGPREAGLRRHGARRGRARCRRGERARRSRTRATRPTSSCARRSSATTVGRWSRTATLPLLQLPSRPCPRAHEGLHEPGFDRFDRGPRPPQVTFVDDDAVQEGVPAAGGLPAEGADARAGRGARRARPAPAAHRRDREVRPRDLLLQRRRRARGAGGEAHPRSPARGTWPPTTRSRR